MLARLRASVEASFSNHTVLHDLSSLHNLVLFRLIGKQDAIHLHRAINAYNCMMCCTNCSSTTALLEKYYDLLRVITDLQSRTPAHGRLVLEAAAVC